MSKPDRIPGLPTRVRRALDGIGSDFVPYIGAIKDTDLGSFSLTTTGVITAEQLTSTDDITMQGHLLTLGDVSAATDTVLSFLGSTNSASITFDESNDEFDFGDADIRTTGDIYGGRLLVYNEYSYLHVVDSDLTIVSQSDLVLDPYSNIVTTSGLIRAGYFDATTEASGYGIAGLTVLHTGGGVGNTCLGKLAGDALTTGTWNTLLGWSAGKAITEGVNNLCVGEEAGLTITTGDYNILFGGNAGKTLITGDENVLIGFNTGTLATGSDNTAIGASCCQNLTTGERNTFIGHIAGDSLTDGVENTFIGANSGQNIASNSRCTGIGYYTGTTADSLTGSVAIGATATFTASNQLVIGGAGANYRITDVYIGDGVTNATPQDVTINATGASGTDVDGVDLILAGGKGTGNATPGKIILKTSVAGASGSTLQSPTTAITIEYDLVDFEGLDLTTDGELDCGALVIDNITINDDVIRSDTTQIDFDDDDLTTTGDFIADSDSSALIMGAGQDASILYNGSYLRIFPEAADNTGRLVFFDTGHTNASNPHIDIYGYKSAGAPLGMKYSRIGLDTYGRLQFSGTVASTQFLTELTIGDNAGTFGLKWPSKGRARLAFNSAGAEDFSFLGLWGSTHDSTYFIFGHEDQRDYDYGLAHETTIPHFMIAARTDNPEYLDLYHNATNGYFNCSSGDLYITAAGGDINFDNENLITTSNVSAGTIKITNIKSGATQAAAGAAADEVWKTNGHATLPDNVLMIGV